MSVVRNSEQRFRKDLILMKKESFINTCKKIKQSHFTRKRKMPLYELLLSLLNRKGLTLIMELRRFNKALKITSSISKAGYLKQRMKLNPDAFLYLNSFHVANFYKEADYVKRKNGYLILAADGSGVNLPTTPETLEAYGSSSKKGTKPQASLGLSCLYDVLNKMILDGSINSCKFNEAQQAEQHLEKLPALIGDNKYLLLLDRGYPSIPLFIRLMERERKFLVRLKSPDFKKERRLMQTCDEDVTITFDRTRIYHYIGTDMEKIMKAKKFITLRLVNIQLPNGDIECLATNLTKEEFSTDEIGQLYSMRWGIETAFDILKNKLELENFTGTKPLLIEQDIYSCMYICNLTQDIIQDIEAEMRKELETGYKHPMMINCSLAIGILKDDLLQIILEKNPRKKSKLFDKMISDIRKNLVPIRPDRHYHRTKGLLAGKYSNTRKRSY